MDVELTLERWEPLREDFEALIRHIPPGCSLAAHAADRAAYICALLGAQRLDCRMFAIPSYWDAKRCRSSVSSSGVAFLVRSAEGGLELRPCAGAAAQAASGLVIFTSGTTGTPKAIEHSWSTATASAAFVGESLRDKTWYLAYEPASYAGLQVIFAARASGGRLIVPPARASLAEHARLIHDYGVEILSATPTWWRSLISSWPQGTEPPHLAQATLGGETADQRTLDLVAGFFSADHLTHVYASSEAGSAIAVSDRRAGFPASYLENSGREIALRVRDGVLEVRSPYRMRGYLRADTPTSAGSDPEWTRTGDLVEIRDERCYFIGREDQQFNVGGLKVRAEEVEAALHRMPQVQDCLVYGRSSPIVGTILAADIVSAAGVKADAQAIRHHLQESLPAHKVPQHIRFVSALEVAPSGKKRRH